MFGSWKWLIWAWISLYKSKKKIKSHKMLMSCRLPTNITSHGKSLNCIIHAYDTTGINHIQGFLRLIIGVRSVMVYGANWNIQNLDMVILFKNASLWILCKILGYSSKLYVILKKQRALSKYYWIKSLNKDFYFSLTHSSSIFQAYIGTNMECYILVVCYRTVLHKKCKYTLK